jgi:alkanesulfonate monooxygenase SsuD/methylene tetrahydromethanopterin reductase-like flavin-dependent oxidoreductase (luciferase family)
MTATPAGAGPGRPRIDVSLSTVDTSAAELARAAATAEAAGFDGVWCYDHLSGTVLRGVRCVDVWVALTAIAGATTSIGLGPLVLNTAARHPGHIAIAVASLQELAEGRVRVGLGAGAGPESPFSRELSMLGLPVRGAAERRARVADTARYLRALWAGERSYEGPCFALSDVDAVAQPAPVPEIVIGANGPRMARVAGTVGDAVNLHDWEPDLEGLAATARDAARGAGRALDVTVEGPLDDAWLDRGSEVHERLGRLGVRRVMVRWTAAAGLPVLSSASRLLAT